VPFPPTNPRLTQRTSTLVSISWTTSVGTNYYKLILSPPAVSQITQFPQTSITFGPFPFQKTYTLYIYAGVNNPSGGAETYETVGIKIYLFIYLFIFSIHYYN